VKNTSNPIFDMVRDELFTKHVGDAQRMLLRLWQISLFRQLLNEKCTINACINLAKIIL